VDEPYHLAAGAGYLHEGMYVMNLEHPPLAKDLAAVPLLFLDLDPPSRFLAETPSAHEASVRWLYENRSGPERLLLLGRLPMVLIAALLPFLVGWLAGRRHGPWAFLVAFLLTAGAIPIAAHAPVVHNDLLFAFLFTAAVCLCWEFLQRPSWGGFALLAAAGSLAAATKFTAIQLGGVLLLLLLVDAVRRAGKRDARGVAIRAGGLAAAGVVAGLFLLVLYAWHMRNNPEGIEAFLVRAYLHGEGWRERLLAVSEVCRPLGHYLTGVGFVLQQNRIGRLGYLLGETSLRGFPLYFPTAFLLKSQTAFLLLLIWRAAAARRIRDPYTVPVLIATGVYVLSAVPTPFNIGVRHLLPVYPLLILWCAALAGRDAAPGRAGKGVLALLLVWYWGAFALAHPHHISYFNELAGGSSRGSLYLLDSNVDWGQDLKRLGRWAEERPGTPIDVHYFGSARVEYYLPEARVVGPGWEPSGGYLAGSVHLLTLGERYYEVYGPQEMVPVARRLDEVLAGREPVASIGHSILVYELEGVPQGGD
jgi:hypothetical protein